MRQPSQTELRRGAIATALGVALGVVAALFARGGREPAETSNDDDRRQGRRWRGRSAT